MINEADITRRFRNLVSTKQLVKKIAQHGYQGEYTEQAIYKLLDKYGIKAKTTRGGKSYFNKKNACTCIDRHIFELKEIAEQLAQQNQPQQEEPEWNVGYGRDDMNVTSREQLANDGVFGSDENELYSDNEDEFANENIFSFKSIVNEVLNYLNEALERTEFTVLRQLKKPVDLTNVRTTFHWDVERNDRKRELAKFLPNAGKPAYSFLVNEGRERGITIHTLTSSGLLYIQNSRTGKVITFFVPKRNEIFRYWIGLDIPFPFDDNAFRNILRFSRFYYENKKRTT